MFSQIVAVVALAGAAIAAPMEKRTSGTATYFYQRGNPGSCGEYSSDSSKIVALPSSMSPNSHCGQTVHISRGDKSITAKAVDTCPSCSSSHIDLSVGAFEALGSKSEGVIDITWYLE